MGLPFWLSSLEDGGRSLCGIGGRTCSKIVSGQECNLIRSARPWTPLKTIQPYKLKKKTLFFAFFPGSKRAAGTYCDVSDAMHTDCDLH